MPDSVELHDALAELEILRRRDERLRFESETMVRAVRILADQPDSRALVGQVVALLHDVFHGASTILLACGPGGELRLVQAVPAAAGEEGWTGRSLLQGLAPDQPRNFFDISAAPGWTLPEDGDRYHRVPALVARLGDAGARPHIAVCLGAPAGSFPPEDFRLFRRLLHLLGQALAREADQAIRDRLEQELRHAQGLEAMGKLAGGVAHEMNNVLGAIMGMAASLRTGCPDGDPRANGLDTIAKACTRGREVVKSLLYFARKDVEATGPVDLNAVVREVMELLGHTTLQRVRLAVSLQENLAAIEGDGNALSHALINLCVNAVDAMPEGGTLEVRTRMREDGAVEVSLEDSGKGMSAEVVRQCLDPFFTTKPTGKGTGLGLALVYGTVKAHRGTLEIRSEAGRGTEMVLAFPPGTGAAAAAQAGPQAAPAPPGRSPLRLLLVDDDDLVRLSVGAMLETLGHEVETAERGEEALDRLREGLEVDLVILDMNMPGLTGAQVLPEILALRPGMPVLMATGYRDDAVAPLLSCGGNVAALNKPFSMNELRAKIQAMVKPGTRTP